MLILTIIKIIIKIIIIIIMKQEMTAITTART